MAPLTAVPDLPESTRHRGRPALTPAERAARMEARKEKRRADRRKARHALEIVTTQESAPAPAPPTPAAPHVYFALGQRARALLGFAVGAFVPLASYMVVHTEVDKRPLMWFLVAGGLLYSSTSVYTWAVQMFHWRLRALGFVVLLESTLTFAASVGWAWQDWQSSCCSTRSTRPCPCSKPELPRRRPPRPNPATVQILDCA